MLTLQVAKVQELHNFYRLCPVQKNRSGEIIAMFTNGSRDEEPSACSELISPGPPSRTSTELLSLLPCFRIKMWMALPRSLWYCHDREKMTIKTKSSLLNCAFTRWWSCVLGQCKAAMVGTWWGQYKTVIFGTAKWLQYYIGVVSQDPKKWLRNMCTTPNHHRDHKVIHPCLHSISLLARCTMLRIVFASGTALSARQEVNNTSFSPRQFEKWKYFFPGRVAPFINSKVTSEGADKI